MLLPSDLDKIGDKVEQWYYYLTLSLVDEMATRISATSEANMVVLNDFNILQQMGKTQNEIYSLIASFNNQSESEVAEIFKGAIKASSKRDNVIFSQNGVKDLKLSESIMQTIQADYVKTKNTLDNLTQTTALSAQEAFIRGMNQAHMQVVSGAKSYTEVMIDTIKKVSQDLDYIEYPSGRKDRVEVAVRRAMVTSVNQTASQVQLNRCMEYGCMLVETSAHIGARPEHEEWQGKVFSLVRGNPKYPYFYDETGYGTATGLCGVNCRHNFFPYYEGTAKAYTASELKKIKDAKVTYNGKTMSYYQATQYQRAMERKVRDYNRTLKGLTSINNANNVDIDAEKVKKEILKVQSKKSDMLKMYADFTKQVGFKEDRSRFIGAGNNKIDLSKFVNKANKQVAKQAKSGKIKTKRDYNCDIAQKFGKEYYDDMKNLLDKVDNKNLVKLWEQFENQIEVGSVAVKDSYCQFGKIYVNKAVDKAGSHYQKPYAIVFHESGHSIDYKTRYKLDDKYGRFFSAKYKDGIFPKTITEEVEAFIAEKDKTLKALFKEHGNTNDYQWFIDNGYLYPWRYNAYKDDEKYLKQLIKYKKEYAYEAVRKEFLKKHNYNLIELADLSDMIEGATYGKCQLGVGHTKKYWRDGKRDGINTNLATEAFAEMFGASITQPESLKTIKQYLPKSYKVFEEMLEILVK